MPPTNGALRGTNVPVVADNVFVVSATATVDHDSDHDNITIVISLSKPSQ
jgi:hypothetical protein